MRLFGRRTSEEITNKEANAALAKAKREQQEKVKLLLLGAGESGKSTIFKQMRILYNNRGLSDEERRGQAESVHKSAIALVQELVRAIKREGKVEALADPEGFEAVAQSSSDKRIDEELAAALKALWADPVVKQLWEDRAKCQISESLEYFMDSIDRLSDPGYTCTKADYLQVRIRTTGVQTAQYTINDVAFEMYDVGGQRNERRKWIHCFEDVKAVIFVAALSEYDQALFEDRHTNRMVEALDLFEEVLNIKFFASTSIILFLNKYDIFNKKVSSGKSPISKATGIEKQGGYEEEVCLWKDYLGGDDPIKARNYFKDKFLEKNKNTSRTIFFHMTTATDTGNIKFVFDAAKDIILEQNIGSCGF